MIIAQTAEGFSGDLQVVSGVGVRTVINQNTPKHLSQAWWHVPIIALWRLRQKEYSLEASLDCREKPCFKNNIIINNTTNNKHLEDYWFLLNVNKIENQKESL